MLVTEGSIGLYGNGLRANIKRLKDALEYCGSGTADHRRMDDDDDDRESRRLEAWRALFAYGYGDRGQEIVLGTEAPGSEVAGEVAGEVVGEGKCAWWMGARRIRGWRAWLASLASA